MLRRDRAKRPALSLQARTAPVSFESLVPAEKKLAPAWLRSLFQRGEPRGCSGQALSMIGMPVGGIGTGQLYLSGDGRLWFFALNPQWRVNTGSSPDDGYAKPISANVRSPVRQGFVLRVGAGDVGRVWSLDRAGFPETSFSSRYPIGHVSYRTADCPVEASLEAFTPYIPLNLRDSSFPATILSFTVRNVSDRDQEVALSGWIENAICNSAKDQAAGIRTNRKGQCSGASWVRCSAAVGEDAEAPLDQGEMALCLLGKEPADFLKLGAKKPASRLFDSPLPVAEASAPLKKNLFASLGRSWRLNPGESRTAVFVVAWRFEAAMEPVFDKYRTNWYAKEWRSVEAVVQEIAQRFDDLAGATRLWAKTFYEESTLPWWFLDRALATAATLQAEATTRFAEDDGVFHLMEGSRCCNGNCTSVWSYAQTPARLFPELARLCRENIEFGAGWHDKAVADHAVGEIDHRWSGWQNSLNPEMKRFWFEAADGTSCAILRVLREHQMSADDQWLKSIWPRVRQTTEHLIRRYDPDRDGVLQGWQNNTLEGQWYGDIAWTTLQYLAALRAASVLSRTLGNRADAARWEAVVAKGIRNIVKRTWQEDWGYFIQTRDPSALGRVGDFDGRPYAPDQNAGPQGSFEGCLIDQLFGESWLRQVGLDPLLEARFRRRTLESIWKYNFVTDVGPYRHAHPAGRWFAMEGDPGTLMCTFPFGGNKALKLGVKQYAGYLNECMTGFEWQLASHMLWEEMVTEGLAVARAIYDRYDPRKRNPFNEVECGNHYSRAMASYGAYLAVCGYEYNGPAGMLGFAPRIQPEKFRAAFTAAAGWGTFSQKIADGRLRAVIEIKWGTLKLRVVKLRLPENVRLNTVEAQLAGRALDAKLTQDERAVVIKFDRPFVVRQGANVEIRLTSQVKAVQR